MCTFQGNIAWLKNADLTGVWHPKCLHTGLYLVQKSSKSNLQILRQKMVGRKMSSFFPRMPSKSVHFDVRFWVPDRDLSEAHFDHLKSSATLVFRTNLVSFWEIQKSMIFAGVCLAFFSRISINRIVKNRQKSSKIVKNRQKWSKMAKNGQKRPKTDVFFSELFSKTKTKSSLVYFLGG